MVSDALDNMPQQRHGNAIEANQERPHPPKLRPPSGHCGKVARGSVLASRTTGVDRPAHWQMATDGLQCCHCGRHHFVGRALPGLTRPAKPVVLKIGFPHTEARDEIPRLQVWQDCGAVPLIDTDDDPNALLMAPCLPADAQLHPAVSADAHRSACREHPRTRRRMDTD